jgi:hypothetical protein
MEKLRAKPIASAGGEHRVQVGKGKGKEILLRIGGDVAVEHEEPEVVCDPRGLPSFKRSSKPRQEFHEVRYEVRDLHFSPVV